MEKGTRIWAVAHKGSLRCGTAKEVYGSNILWVDDSNGEQCVLGPKYYSQVKEEAVKKCVRYLRERITEHRRQIKLLRIQITETLEEQ